MADDWSAAEVNLIVADYFEMLQSELLGQAVNKTEHRNALAPRLNERSKGSIEFKHQNISAVLVNMGLPYINGYKPRGNYQALLGTSVQQFLDDHPGFFEQLADAKRLNPSEMPGVAQTALDQIFVPPPEQIIVPPEPGQPWLSRKGRKLDFARRDAENRRLGKLGEQWVVEVEKRRLLEHGRDDLAKKVEWVAETCGDGLGFDVLSFTETNDSERYVEVKTTGLGKFFPFLVTANEVRCSEALPDRFHLYRVFNFSTSARLYVLPGSLREKCQLDPVLYRASL
jgi:hypothetical protein